VTRDRADRTDAETVIAAQQDGQVPGPQLGQHGVVHETRPCRDFGQVAIAVHGRQRRVARSVQVAPIDDLDAL